MSAPTLTDFRGERLSAVAYRKLVGAPTDADRAREAASVAAMASPTMTRSPAPTGVIARGQLAPRKMNGTESAYDAHLWSLRAAGAVLWHEFEALKFRLADDTYYTPDFAVLRADLTFELHETKGFWRDDAKVKIKVAASLFPFRFIAFRKVSKADGGGWSEEAF
ncbi:DUF1064 domain-containing protein [Methylobacterium sp. D53M]